MCLTNVSLQIVAIILIGLVWIEALCLWVRYKFAKVDPYRITYTVTMAKKSHRWSQIPQTLRWFWDIFPNLSFLHLSVWFTAQLACIVGLTPFLNGQHCTSMSAEQQQQLRESTPDPFGSIQSSSPFSNTVTELTQCSRIGFVLIDVLVCSCGTWKAWVRHEFIYSHTVVVSSLLRMCTLNLWAAGGQILDSSL